MESRRVGSSAPRHALVTDDDVIDLVETTADSTEPRHAEHGWRARRYLPLLAGPIVVATVITAVVVAFKPAPTTAAEPLTQKTTAASAGATAAPSAQTPSSTATGESAQPSVDATGSGAAPATAAPTAAETTSPLPSATSTAASSAQSTSTTDPTSSAEPTGEPTSSAAATSAADPTKSAEPTTSASASAEGVATRWTTASLNVRATPSAGAKVLGTLAPGTTVQITANTSGAFQQVVWKKSTAWVTARYLATKKPEIAVNGAAVSGAPCKSGSAVEAGLVRNAIAVHRAVCAAFPSVTRYGGRGGGGAHAAGRAIDIMVTGATGWEIANWLRAHAAELGITEVIFAQRIWTTQRSREGWRSMRSRGSATANHYDHVHVTVR